MRIVLLCLLVASSSVAVYGASFYFTAKFLQRGEIVRLENLTCVKGKMGIIRTSTSNQKEIVFPKDARDQFFRCGQT